MSLRPLNPYAQPYFSHHFHPHHSFLCEVSSCMQNPIMNQDHYSNMEAAAMDQNPRVVVPRRKTKNFRRGRNVGPRLRSSRTSLAGNLAEGSRTATRVWEPESEASNFGSTGNWGGTVAPSSSRSGGKNSMGRRKVGLRLSPGPSHGIQAPSFPNGKGSLIPLPQSPDEQNGSEVTTLMIKNIPWNLRRGDLLLILKEHCQEENKKAGSLLKSEFNFFYLPLDFEKFWKRKRISNLGYAFVNFTTAVGAQRFYEKYHMFMWKEIIQSTKVCEISCAKIQGFKALEKWFRGKLYRGLRNDFLPVILAPACDGVRESNHIPVGHLL